MIGPGAYAPGFTLPVRFADSKPEHARYLVDPKLADELEQYRKNYKGGLIAEPLKP